MNLTFAAAALVLLAALFLADTYDRRLAPPICIASAWSGAVLITWATIRETRQRPYPLFALNHLLSRDRVVLGTMLTMTGVLSFVAPKLAEPGEAVVHGLAAFIPSIALPALVVLAHTQRSHGHRSTPN